MRCTKYALDFGFHWQHAPLFVTILPFHNLSHNMRLLTQNSISELTEDVSVCLCSTESVEWYRERATEWNKNRWQKRKNDERDRKKCVLHAEPVFVWLLLQMLFSLASSVFLSHKWVSVRFAMFVPSYFFHSIPRNVNHKFMWFSILVVLLHTHTKKCVVVTIA